MTTAPPQKDGKNGFGALNYILPHPDAPTTENVSYSSTPPEVQDIFDTLTNTGETYSSAKKSLADHFAPEENIPFSRHLFRQEKQRDGETISQFVTRLRQLAEACDFKENTNDFIRDQVIDKCNSKRLRTKLLAAKDLTLAKLLDIAQAKEASERQATQITKDRQDKTYYSR